MPILVIVDDVHHAHAAAQDATHLIAPIDPVSDLERRLEVSTHGRRGRIPSGGNVFELR